jgi:hypothetical protein
MYDPTEFNAFARGFFSDEHDAFFPEEQNRDYLSFTMPVARHERLCCLHFDGCYRAILAIRVGPSILKDPVVGRRFLTLFDRSNEREPFGGVIEDTEAGLFWNQETNVATLDPAAGGTALTSILVYAESDIPRLDVLTGLAVLPLPPGVLPKLPPTEHCFPQGSA